MNGHLPHNLCVGCDYDNGFFMKGFKSSLCTHALIYICIYVYYKELVLLSSHRVGRNEREGHLL